MANRIRRNDQVEVIAGKDKGKRGRVLRVIADRNRVLVEGVGMIKKHVKANPQRNVQGGIVEQEAAIHISNVMLIGSDDRRTRVSSKIEGESKVRYSRRTGEAVQDSQK